MRFRVATRRDITQLRRIDNESAQADMIDGTKSYVLRRRKVLDHFLNCKGVLVAEINGQVVAYALTHPLEWMHGIRRLIWIEHIGVHPEHRCKGIGLGLLRFVRRHHKAQAAYLYAEIHPLNSGSIALFEKFGVSLVERKLAFKKI